jgi:hypothetical protein
VGPGEIEEVEGMRTNTVRAGAVPMDDRDRQGTDQGVELGTDLHSLDIRTASDRLSKTCRLMGTLGTGTPICPKADLLLDRQVTCRTRPDTMAECLRTSTTRRWLRQRDPCCHRP